MSIGRLVLGEGPGTRFEMPWKTDYGVDGLGKGKARTPQRRAFPAQLDGCLGILPVGSVEVLPH